MIRDFILANALVLLLVIFAIYTITKVALMHHAGIRHNKSGFFLESIFPVNRQTIKNTFHDRERKYYKLSNKVNTWFYLVFGLLALVYLFLTSIK